MRNGESCNAIYDLIQLCHARAARVVECNLVKLLTSSRRCYVFSHLAGSVNVGLGVHEQSNNETVKT
jgi:L-alanine-DL-glutamate epimerase-like enolase superfamily enzyme